MQHDDLSLAVFVVSGTWRFAAMGEDEKDVTYRFVGALRGRYDVPREPVELFCLQPFSSRRPRSFQGDGGQARLEGHAAQALFWPLTAPVLFRRLPQPCL